MQADNDGVCGDVDTCPAIVNADQADSDGDGIGEACETSAALAISDVKVVWRNKRVITVTALIGNPNDTMVYDVTITGATLDGSATNSTLPIVPGVIKPDSRKKTTLQFKETPRGEETLTIEGTSSLSSFRFTQQVIVP